MSLIEIIERLCCIIQLQAEIIKDNNYGADPRIKELEDKLSELDSEVGIT